MRGLIFMIALLLTQTLANAQEEDKYWGKGSEYNRMYNPASIVKLEGRIVGILSYTPDGGSHSGVHIKLHSGKRTYDIHLGPSWYIDEQDMKLMVDDEITVTGSKVKFKDGEIIIASKIEKGSTTMKLREKDGTPLWSRRGRR